MHTPRNACLENAVAFAAEDMIDRRRLRRKLSVWRVAALALLALVVVAAPFALGLPTPGGTMIGDSVARVEISGLITEDAEMLELLSDLKDDASVRAVVVKINSPGGTTVGGETLYQAIRDIAAVKPVAAEIGTLAASAGYLVATASDHVVAHSTSIVGTIGVIFQYVDASVLLGRIGVDVNAIKSSPLKAEPSPFSPAPPEARAMIERLIASSYDWFVGLVEERRGLPRGEVLRLADGSVFSGAQGLDNGLVDALGGEAEIRRWFADEHGLDRDIRFVEREPDRDRPSILSAAGLRYGLFSLLGLDPGAESLPQALRRSAGQLDGLLALWQPPAGF